MERSEILELLEVVAGERPELLPALAGVLRGAGVGGEVAESWGVEVAALAATTRAAAANLRQLERGRWNRKVEPVPNACAVLDLATARAGRVAAPRKLQRLERIRQKLADVAEHERIRRRLLAFLAEPVQPVKLSRFMPERRAGPV